MRRLRYSTSLPLFFTVLELSNDMRTFMFFLLGMRAYANSLLAVYLLAAPIL